MVYKKILYYWAPALLWTGTIYYFSSQHRISITSYSVLDFVIFKSFHLIEYAILYFLWFRVFYSIQNKYLTLNHKFILAFAIALIYALTDEFHQLFVPSRQGKIRDVFIDTTGIFLMYTLIKKTLPSIRKLL